jgi:hypothetical protein
MFPLKRTGTYHFKVFPVAAVAVNGLAVAPTQ